MLHSRKRIDRPILAAAAVIATATFGHIYKRSKTLPSTEAQRMCYTQAAKVTTRELQTLIRTQVCAALEQTDPNTEPTYPSLQFSGGCIDEPALPVLIHNLAEASHGDVLESTITTLNHLAHEVDAHNACACPNQPKYAPIGSVVFYGVTRCRSN